MGFFIFLKIVFADAIVIISVIEDQFFSHFYAMKKNIYKKLF